MDNVKEIMERNFHKQVQVTLEEAKGILYAIDSEIDKFEGKDIYEAMIKVQDYLLQWNLLSQNFVTNGIYDWIEPEKQLGIYYEITVTSNKR